MTEPSTEQVDPALIRKPVPHPGGGAQDSASPFGDSETHFPWLAGPAQSAAEPAQNKSAKLASSNATKNQP